MDKNYNKFENSCLFEFNNHAFLIEVDESYNTNFVIDIVKQYIKKNIFDDQLYFNIFNLIDKNIFPDLKVIRPDGKFIKKEQLMELMTNFKCKSIYNLKKIYVIEYAENLNQSSGNALLKFLEEPNDDIVAILITKNYSNVLGTIASRCQLLNFNLYKTKEYSDDKVIKALDYIKVIEDKKEKAVAYLSELYLFKLEELKDIFNIFLLIYDDILKLLILRENINLKKFKLEIDEISKNCDIERIISKIKLIERMIELTDYNVNSRIILDQMLIGG